MNASLYFQPHPKQMGKVNTLPTGQSLFQVVGRFVPNQKYGEDDPQCKVYRMKIFAKNKVVARSRFWYFMGRLCRVKKANGQIVSVNQVRAPPQRARPHACSPPHRALASYAARPLRRSLRSRRRRSRTLASGSGTTRVPARTTRTRSTVRLRSPTLSTPSVRRMPAVAFGSASAAASRAGSPKPRGAAIRQCRRRQQCRATRTARAVTLASEQRQGLEQRQWGFSCGGAARPAPPHPSFLTLPLTDQNMAGLSRAKAASIQILRTAELKASECKRPAIMQFHVRTARSQVAAPRPCASSVRSACGHRLGPPLGACPPGLRPRRSAPRAGCLLPPPPPPGPAGIG